MRSLFLRLNLLFSHKLKVFLVFGIIIGKILIQLLKGNNEFNIFFTNDLWKLKSSCWNEYMEVLNTMSKQGVWFCKLNVLDFDFYFYCVTYIKKINI